MLDSERRLIMNYANNELKYAKCAFCGLEKTCFVDFELDEEQTVCLDCLFVEDRA